ncbi:glycoside hydrolase family 44 protein [Nocardioides cynanchi]|uniref:glycoside hydrolase family 44 protein n=1 Tax=Nocardioides cynanchi TaxID=2558918 RepID=UPI0017818304|nr:glycoside hydrolase family 44 protein [Nocardioides cynanchi]
MPVRVRHLGLAAVVAALMLGPLLAAQGRTVAPLAPGRSSGPRLVVDVAAHRHRISPDIYGANGAGRSFARRTHLPVDRWGGNSAETYNWKIRGSNHGNDWYFENFPDCWTPAFGYCATGHGYSAVDAQIRQDRASGTQTLLTLPLDGRVANAVTYDNSNPCSFPAARYDPQDDHDPYHPACGNGRHNGAFVAGPDASIAGTRAGAAFDGAWVSHLVRRYGAARRGGVGIYELGNEPGLWDQTHHDFHPKPVGYDELWARSVAAATAVKAADPTAAVLGPAEWGWPNYFCSSVDLRALGSCDASSPDRAAHGGAALSSWYLRRFAAAQARTGTRLLDYFDLHYYPQGSYQPATDVTRSLWDPHFRDPSWIDHTIRLLPRMRAWVHHDYPGTRLSLSEYNLGLGVSSSRRVQTVIEADTLGIFGEQGLSLATYWPEASAPVPGSAFAMFRNYDGRHHTFGDVSVRAASSGRGRLSVYAAQHGGHGAVTVIVVNKTSSALSSPLSLRHFRARAHATTYTYAGHGIQRQPDTRVGADGFTRTYPAQSVTLVALAPR